MILVLIVHFWKAHVFWIDKKHWSQVGDIICWQLIDSDQYFEILRASCAIF